MSSKLPWRWDHIVHLVNQVEEPIEWMKQLKLVARKGGEHPRWGTINSLSQFGITYIEFITLRDKQLLAEHQKKFAESNGTALASVENCLVNDIVRQLPQHQILSRVVLRCSKGQIEKHYERFRQEGLEVWELMPGARRTTTGELIEWKLFFVNGEASVDTEEKKWLQKIPYPFFLEWGQETDEERLQWLKDHQVDVPHPLAEKVRLRNVVWQVERPAVIAARWSHLFQLPSRTVKRPNGEEVPALLSGEEDGDQLFIFEKGSTNGIVALELEASDPSVKGKTQRLGDSEYRFI